MAICYSEAGQPGRALEIYEAHLAESAFQRRDYGFFLALKAAAYAAAKEPDSAAAAALSALTIAQSTRSARTHREVLRVVGQLRPWERRPAVQELRQTILG